MRVGHVIYFNSAGAALWCWRGRGFVQSPVTIPAGGDATALVAELRRLEPAPIAVLVDMIDEEHVRDTVARLGKRDQQALLGRKLARAFPRTPFRTALVQGRSPRNPDESQVVLSALTRPEPVRELLASLAAAKLPVLGVFSPALLTERLLDAPARSADAVLLVLRRANGRLQHSFFRNGRLAGSRRLRGLTGVVHEDGGYLQRQIEESLRYFDPTYEATAERPLQLLLSPGDLDLLGQANAHGDTWQMRTLATADLNRRLRLPPDVGLDHSERYYIEMLRDQVGVGNLAPGPDRRYFQMFRVRSQARVACLVVAWLALAGALSNSLFILDSGQQLAGSTAAVSQLETVLPDSGSEDGAGVNPLLMREVVTAYDALASHQADPAAILAAIGTAVTARPEIQVDAIQWTAGPPEVVATPAADAGADATAVPLETAGTTTAPAADGVTITLRGHVAPFRGDYLQAFAEIEAFVEALRANPAVQAVRPKAQPLDVSPRSTLTGEAGGAASATLDAPFTVEIVMRLPDAAA